MIQIDKSIEWATLGVEIIGLKKAILNELKKEGDTMTKCYMRPDTKPSDKAMPTYTVELLDGTRTTIQANTAAQAAALVAGARALRGDCLHMQLGIRRVDGPGEQHGADTAQAQGRAKRKTWAQRWFGWLWTDNPDAPDVQPMTADDFPKFKDGPR